MVAAVRGLPVLWSLSACGAAATIPEPTAPEDPATADTAATAPTAPTGETRTPTAEPVCSYTATTRSCPHQTLRLTTGPLSSRDVHFQVPNGEAPPDGWPVAVLFQGSFFSASTMWDATKGDPFGGWNQTGVVASLLAAGFAVVTPEAQGGGNTFWNTNVPPWSFLWTTSPDADLMSALFAALDDGSFGAVDPDRLYAAGISSGGYMTSRMALSYPGRFRALAIHSASWATCSGPLCVLPELPADHPPTLFLHGEDDVVVPISTMWIYADRLDVAGFEVRVVTDPAAGHEWIDVAPAEIVDWFEVR